MRAQVISLALVALLIAFSGVAEAQQTKKVHRIGYLSGSDRATDSPRSEAIRRGLRELGYVEGQNIAIEYRYAEGKRDRQAELAAELVRLKVDLIVVAGGDTVIQAAKNATETIPLVTDGQGGDPVKAGFVKSLARPGGNITGFTNLTTELGGKRLELLKEAIPKLVHVAVLFDPGALAVAREMKDDLPVAAHGLGLTIRSWEVRQANDFEKIFATLNKDRPDGLYPASAGSVMRANLKRIANFALKSQLPSVGSSTQYSDAGGLMSYAADLADGHRRVATYVDKILKGAKPADLPVEQPTKFELVINLKTAKQIGLTIPDSVLAKTDKVIK